MTNDYFQRVGDTLSRRLGEVNVPGDHLADLATAVLREIGPSESIGVEHMADWIMNQRDLPRQVNFDYEFGEPPLTVYNSEHFYIEVLFWFPSRTAIHGHGFHGAFRVLAGQSLQSRYRFSEDDSPCRGFRLGRLELSGLDLLDPGSVFTIEPREGLLHCVMHLGRPSLTLVVRSRTAMNADQYSYYRCGLAYMPFLHKHRMRRQLDVIDVLRRVDSSRYRSELVKYFRRGDALQRFVTMDHCRRVAVSTEELGENLDMLTAEGGSQEQRMREAVREKVRSDAMWSGLKKFPVKRQRLEVAVLELLGGRAAAENAFQEYLGGEWQELIPEWSARIDI